MAILFPLTTEALKVAVTATHAEFAAQMASGDKYLLTSNTNFWCKQASPTASITVDTNANQADGDTITINDGINAAYVYEYDKAADGVTGGSIAWPAGTTALSNATALAALITANQTHVTVVNNGDGTLSLTTKYGNLTVTKSSASGIAVSFTPIATRAAGSMYWPANTPLVLDGLPGSNVSILRDTADGSATLVRCMVY